MIITDPKNVRYLLTHEETIILIRHGEVTADDKGNKHTFPILSKSSDETYSSFRKARLQNGVREVQTILGPSVNVKEKSIEDSLWHYYYDVDKTVNYLLRKLRRSCNTA